MLIRWVDRLRMSGRLVASFVLADDSDSFVCDFCLLLIGTSFG